MIGAVSRTKLKAVLRVTPPALPWGFLTPGALPVSPWSFVWMGWKCA